MLTYQEALNLKKGDRLKAYGPEGWKSGTITGKGTVNSSPVLWIDEDESPSGISVAYYIGTNLSERGWDALNAGKTFSLIEEQANLF